MKTNLKASPTESQKKSRRSSSQREFRHIPAEDSLREYQAILATAEEVARVGSWKWDLRTQKLTWSDEMFRLFGVEKEGFDGDLNRVIEERIHPEDVAAVTESNRGVLEEARPLPLSYRIVLPGGLERTVWAQGRLVHDDAGQPVALMGYVQDITERVQAEKKILQLKRMYATLSQVNQVIVRVRDRQQLFQMVCDVAVEFGEFSLAWVALLDDASGEIRPAASRGWDINQWPFPNINIFQDKYKSTLTATAIRTASVVTSENIHTDARLQSFRSQLTSHAYHASAIVPLRLGGQIIAILGLGSPEKGVFQDPAEVKLLEEVGVNISFALDNMEKEQLRQQAEKKILQLKRMYATLSQVNQVIVRVKDRDELFQAICDIAVKYGEVSPAWIGLVDEETGEIRPVVANGLDIKQWVHPVINIKHGSYQNGLIMEAIHSSRVVTSEDVQIDSRTRDMHSQLRDLPFHSLAIVPFRLRGRTIGILALISSQKGLFMDIEEVRLLEEMALDISFALDKIESENEHRLAEKALQESENRYRDLVETSHDGIFINSQGRIVFINRRGLEMLGATQYDQVIGLSPFEIFHPDFHPLIRERIKCLLVDERTVPSVEEKIVTLDGRVIPVEVTAARVMVDGAHSIQVILRDITERKQAEEALKKSEQQLRALVTASSEALYRMSPDWGIMSQLKSNGFLSNTEQPNPDWVDEYIHPDDQSRVTAAIREAIRTKSVFELEHMVLRVDGSLGWTFSRAIPVLDTNGDIQEWFGAASDITERKKAEEQLRASEERYRNLIENMNDIVMEVDASGNYCYISPNFAAISDYSIDEELGASALKRIHPDDLPMVIQKLGQAFHSERQSAVYRVQRKNGEWRWLETVGKPYRASDGSLHLITVARDITERKQAEDSLKRNERVLRLFVEHSPASIAMFDQDMRYIVASKRYLVDYRLGEQDVTGRSHYEIFPEIPERWREIHRRCLAGAIEQCDEDPFPREDGQLDWVRWEIRPWYEEAGTIGGIILFSEVITARKQTEDELKFLNIALETRVAERTEELHRLNLELQSANNAKTEFLANMSHELRTPLNTVLGLSESLLEQRRGPLNEKQVQSIKLIAASGQHLLELINDILEVSKIEAGKLELRPTEVSIREVCESSINFIRQLALKKSISVEFNYDLSLSTLYADPQRLKQILINLLTNAVKFTPEGGRVSLEVHLDADRDQILFSVSDTGIGIAVEDLKKLFTPFTQLDSSLARQYAGTGLGLALVQKLTDLHGGSVQVESEVNAGSRFTIALPVYQGQLEQRLPKKTVETVSPRQNMISPTLPDERRIVLLAEDNRINAEMMVEYLEAYGYRVIVAQDGEDVLEKVNATTPNIILMDIQMPKLDGLEATRRLRMDARFASTPIVALTALAMPGDKERCLEAGVDEYLSKPVSLRLLIKVINKFTGQSM